MTDLRGQNPYFAGYEEAFAAAEERILRALHASPRLIRDYTVHLAQGRGKQIRARALLACSQLPDGRIPADAVQFAAAVELLHLATLVHDDVIDDADLRRGVPTLQRRFGRRAAVICGDWLLSLSLRMAADLPDRERYLQIDLPDYVGRVCLGELRQQLANRDFDLSVERYLKIIGGKTAALFEGAYGAGAILCTDDPRTRARYRKLGRSVGMIFQLTDDCIDFELDEATAQKPVQSDYEQGVVTLPLIHALGQDATFCEQVQAGTITRHALNAKVRERGGLDYTRWLSRRYYDRAKRLMEQLDMTPEKAGRLTELLDKAFWGPQLRQTKEEIK